MRILMHQIFYCLAAIQYTRDKKEDRDRLFAGYGIGRVWLNLQQIIRLDIGKILKGSEALEQVKWKCC